MAEIDAELAETRAFNEGLAQLLARQPEVQDVPVEETRRARSEGGGIFPPPVLLPQARELEVAGRDGRPIRLRVLALEGEAAGVYLHFHGGGWTLGAADGQDPYLWALVEATGLAAVSVEYRLAPEHPFPAGPDDCEDAALWLLDHGLDVLGAPARLALGGESAGAHLAVLTLLRLRDLHGRTGDFAAANLVYGGYDLSLTPSSRLWRSTLVLSRANMAWFGDNFCPGTDLEGRRDPAISPLYADLGGLPPALLTVGTGDPLLDDSLFLAARWRAAGNRAELRVYEEAVHGFNLFPLSVARRANEAAYAFLRQEVSRWT